MPALSGVVNFGIINYNNVKDKNLNFAQWTSLTALLKCLISTTTSSNNLQLSISSSSTPWMTILKVQIGFKAITA